MNILDNLYDQPEPPEGFHWIVKPATDTQPRQTLIAVLDDNYNHAADRLCSDNITVAELELLADRGDNWVALTAATALATRLVEEGNADA